MAKHCIHDKPWHCKHCSLSVLAVYWLNNYSTAKRKYLPKYYYSDLKEDKKDREKGIEKLKERIIEKNSGKYRSWAIFDNQMSDPKDVLDSYGKV